MREIFVADAHCDFLYGMYRHHYDIRELSAGQSVYLPYLRQGGVKLQFFAIWIDRALKTPPLQQCLGMVDAYYRMLDENDTFTPLTRDFSPDGEKIATVLTVESGEAIEGSLAALRVLKKLGVAAMTLTWNQNNELAGAAMGRGGKGLTTLGRETVKEMERINIAVDVSHLSDEGIDDLLGMAQKPIFASHSNARGVYDCPRALADAHIAAIAAKGGVVGVNFFYKQLCGNSNAGIEDIVKHILHIVKVGGIGCCCIGSDFDGMTQYPRDLENSAMLQDLAAALLRTGLSREDVERVAYKNLYDYIIGFLPKVP
ncbi:MAG: dipeptidase [Clostridiales bacterium]|jgi:membrane dipeptidase|nr:dipeptidase [Clostridiales bacterium]